MASKRKVKTPGRYIDDERWYIVQFIEDDEYSYPVRSREVQDEGTGESAMERDIKVGDCCRAPWLNGKSYSGKVVFINENKEECLRFRSRGTNTYEKQKKNGAAKRNSQAVEKVTGSSQKAELAKKKKENAESKKQIEKNRREVAINTAEEIFKKSLHIYPAAHNAVVTLTQPSAPGTQMTPLASATLTLPSVSTSSNHPPASATPTQQLASVIPTQTLAPVTPTQALASAIPTQPLASTTQPHPPEITTQTHPLAPVTPTQPIAPDTLTQSLATVTPTNPLAHGTQTQPQAPAVQTQSQTPATLTHPSVSTTLSVTPTYPLAYITSTHPLTPVTTTVPSSPAAPIYPRAPVTPTQPLAPFSKSYSNLNSPSTPKSTMPLQEIDLPVNTRHSTPKAAEYSFLGDLSQITPIQNQNISQSPQYLETSTASAALAALRDDCYDCQMKDRDLSSMREYCCGLENDLQYLRSEVSRLQQELERSSLSSSISRSNANHYYPRRGMRIDKCVYITRDQSSTEVPEDYIPLMPGHQVFVPSTWMCHVQSTFRQKTKTWCLKNMLSGIFEPEEVLNMTSTTLFATPIGQALRDYATTKLGMDSSSVVQAVNSKIGTMTRAVKCNRVIRH